MTTDTTIPIALLCNEYLLHFILKWGFGRPTSIGVADIDNMNFEEACMRYAANAFRKETKYTDNEAFLMRWNYFRRLFPKKQYEGIVLAAMEALYEDFLEERRGKIHVKLERYGEWQNLMANVNLGPLAAYAAHKASMRIPSWTQSQRELVRDSLLTANALCYPYDILVEEYIKEKGLNDAHLHINACTFAELNWLRAISNPKGALLPFSAIDGTLLKKRPLLQAIRQQFSDLYGNTPTAAMEQHLYIARNLRILLREYTRLDKSERTLQSFNNLNTWVYSKTNISVFCIEDIAQLNITGKLIDEEMPWHNHEQLIRDERKWMSQFIHLISMEDFNGYGTWLLPCFHAYILLMNEYCGLFIQRESQTGFDQFKNTSRLKGPYELDAQYYLRCFQHFHGDNAQSDIHYLDARIAPREDKKAYTTPLSNILHGYAYYLKGIWEKLVPETEIPPNVREAIEMISMVKPKGLFDIIKTLRPKHPFRYLQLGITIHFLKRPWERKTESSIRFRANRLTLEKQSQELKKLLTDIPEYATYLHSVDAASDESCVPPSVFAPCFRYCRRELNMERITFHCGESFPHLLTGLRTMDDTLRLLELKSGDRIGHGTALGMDPTFWREQQGETAYIRTEDRMLDLLYAFERLKHERHIPGAICEKLKDELMTLAHRIFSCDNRRIDPHILKEAMDMRGLCPFQLEKIFNNAVSPISAKVVCEFKRNTIPYLLKRRIKIRMEGEKIIDMNGDPELEHTIQTLLKAPSDAILLLHDWQFDARTWEVGEQIIRVELQKEDDDYLLTLQQQMMHDFYHAKVIIETLITSNIRIACYHKAKEHHAIRWLLHRPDKCKEEPNLLLCFGSDDPAIFSCDAKADFYLLYATLHEHGVKEQDALQLLDRINERGRTYSFPPPRNPLSASNSPKGEENGIEWHLA